MIFSVQKPDKPKTITYSALVDPKQKLVASKKIQQAYRADGEVCTMFRKTADKVTGDMLRMKGTLDQWKRLAEVWNGK